MSAYSVVTIIPGPPLVAANSVRAERPSQLPQTDASGFFY
jgi:hypothetical protein